jgi:hypothetical protein
VERQRQCSENWRLRLVFLKGRLVQSKNKFMKKHPTGEMSKEEFIEACKQLGDMKRCMAECLKCLKCSMKMGAEPSTLGSS